MSCWFLVPGCVCCSHCRGWNYRLIQRLRACVGVCVHFSRTCSAPHWGPFGVNSAPPSDFSLHSVAPSLYLLLTRWSSSSQLPSDLQWEETVDSTASCSFVWAEAKQPPMRILEKFHFGTQIGFQHHHVGLIKASTPADELAYFDEYKIGPFFTLTSFRILIKVVTIRLEGQCSMRLHLIIEMSWTADARPASVWLPLMCNAVIILIGLKLQRPTEQLPKSGETQYVKTGGKHRRRADVPWSITQIPMTGNNWKVSCDHSLHRSTSTKQNF